MSVIIPGSYDPVTLGHLEIIREVAARESEVYAVVFINENKKYRFTLDERVCMLELATQGIKGVKVAYSTGRVVDFMREWGIEKIVKGYRTEADLPWEEYQARYNFENGGYETELIKCKPEFSGISSTLVRERLDMGEDISSLVPKKVRDYINARVNNRKDNIK